MIHRIAIIHTPPQRNTGYGYANTIPIMQANTKFLPKKSILEIAYAVKDEAIHTPLIFKTQTINVFTKYFKYSDVNTFVYDPK